MLKYALLCSVLCCFVLAEPPAQGIKPSNVLGGAEQHASFSFVRPGLTQTSFAFSGPSSHQAFSSSIGNPQLAHRVLPNIAHALAYRNPGLGFVPAGTIANGYASAPFAPAFAPSVPAPLPYHVSVDPNMLAYLQQLQLQQAQLRTYPAAYHPQLQQLLALRQAQAQAQVQSAESEQVAEQVQADHQQRPQHSQNLLGVAYSAAPSVAHVKVSANGYKFDF